MTAPNDRGRAASHPNPSLYAAAVRATNTEWTWGIMNFVKTTVR